MSSRPGPEARTRTEPWSEAGRTVSFAVHAFPAVSTGAADVRETRTPVAAAALQATAARQRTAPTEAIFLTLLSDAHACPSFAKVLANMVREPTRSAMWALAHPIRFRIWELLREGPATASHLARRLGESRGSTSYHLRMLGSTGVIVDDEELGTKRERWWRRPEEPVIAPSPADPEGRAIMD